MAERCFLGVDLGAESGRVVAGLFDGQRIRLEEIHRFSNGAVHVADSLRWDVLKLWSEIQSGLAKAAGSFGNDAISIGVDTWGVDYVLLSKTGEMLGQPYHYRDPRTAGVMDRALGRVARKDIFAATGVQFMPINTLYQLIATQQVNPRLMDLADRFLMMPDLFHWLLCGSQVVEFTNATTSQCVDPISRTWAHDLLGKFEIPGAMFPEVVLPGTRLGKLRADVAGRCRLPRLEVVAPATHDTGSAVAAVPTALTGTTKWAYISSGTWSLMGLELPHPVLTPRALEYNVTNEGGIDGTFRLLKNIMGLWLVQECRRSFERGGKTLTYAELAHLAGQSQPFRSLVDPDDGNFLSPADMPMAIRQWCQARGETAPDSEGQFIRCALESLALKYRMVLGWLEELAGTRVEVIHIVGGGSQNELLNQFTANACGRPVVAGPIEATALGNVLVQARTSGAIGSLAEMRAVVQASSALKRYEPRDQSHWNEAYGRFCEVLKRPG
ncbi:MAG: rhamnulokinase [Planctomycetaceae bacterium]|nr:rhamnulokinase [Planctomycetaceae bacterium]